MSNIANDDWPIFVVRVVAVGDRPAAMFSALREVLHLTPASAKAMLLAPGFEVARGCRMDVERIATRFQQAGATIEYTVVSDSQS